MIFPEDLSNSIYINNISTSNQHFQCNSPSSNSPTSSYPNPIYNLPSSSSHSSQLYFPSLDYYSSSKETSKQFKGRNFIPKSHLVNEPKYMNSTSSFQTNEQMPSIEKPVTVNLICQYFYNNFPCQNTFNIINNSNSSTQYPLSEHKKYNNNETNKYKTNYNNLKNDLQINNSKHKSNTNVLNKKENTFDDMSIDFLIKNVYAICGNQGGCRHLQKIIEQYPNKAIEFYEQIRINIYELSLDSFGNYFIQKLLEYLPINILLSIFVESFTKDFLSICISPHGTRVIQKFLERAFMNQELMNLFNPFFYTHINEIILDANATHIVIKYFSLIKFPHNEKMISFFKNNILMLSKNKHSCCTIQKCIELITDQTQLYDIINSIANVAHLLFNDQYGNYIVQYSLGFNIKELNSVIIQKYFTNIDTVAYQKISSNVFEKCLHYCSIQERTNIIKYLCNKEIVRKLLLNTYGNYILRQAMEFAQENEKKLFIQYISEYLGSLKILLLENVAYSKLLKKFPEILI